MSKKILRILTAVSLLTVLLVSMSTVVFATPGTPYGSYNTTKTITKGEAVIYQCSCNPVDNYLKASCKIQYKNPSNGQYTTTAYNDSVGYDTTGRVSSWTVSGTYTVNYVWGRFEAKCGSGDVCVYTKNVGTKF